METTTLQQRIEERATKNLLKDLKEATDKLKQVGSLIDHKFDSLLDVREHYEYSNKVEIKMYGESSQEIFDKLLPRYISDVTDEILHKVDEIDWLLANQNEKADY